jgi:dihydrolipoamide dehydrogenase
LSWAARRERTAQVLWRRAPRVTYTDPQAASVGAVEGEYQATTPVVEVPNTSTCTHDYSKSNGFFTLLSDRRQLAGACALCPEAGEWSSRRRWPSAPTFRSRCSAIPSSGSPVSSGIYDPAMMALRMQIANMPLPSNRWPRRWPL